MDPATASLSPGSRSRASLRITWSSGSTRFPTPSIMVCSPLPTSIANGIPPRNPLGVVSQVLKSPWASNQIRVGSIPACCKPPKTPMLEQQSPATLTGSSPEVRAVLTSFARGIYSATILACGLVFARAGLLITQSGSMSDSRPGKG